MPLYDYRCTKCGEEVEVMHGIHATGPDSCESCGGSMKKVLSPPTIHFKGSGWAKKDAAAATAKKAKPKGGASGTSSSTDKGEKAPKESSAKDSKPKSEAKSAPAKDGSKASPKAG